MKLKNLNAQTIFITGATSGIGLTTARMAAEQGVLSFAWVAVNLYSCQKKR